MSETHDKQKQRQDAAENEKKKGGNAFQRVLTPFKKALASGQLGLATTAWKRYQTTGQLDDLNRALEHFEAAVAKSHAGSRDYPAFLINLGVGLREHYLRTGDTDDLDRAIQVWQEAGRLMPSDAPNRSAYLNNVGLGLYERYVRNGAPDDLALAIQFYEEAVQASKPGSSQRAACLNNLGNMLRIRYAYSGVRSDLDRAIELLEEALQLLAPGAPERPSCLNSLGDNLRIRSTFAGNLPDLERAIQVYAEAVQRSQLHAPDRPMYLSNLGTALRMYYTQTGDKASLKQAIEALDEAVAQTPASTPNRATYLNNLGTGLRTRFDSFGAPGDLERAIQAWDEAVQASPLDSPDLPGRLSCLGVGLGMRYVRSGDLADLERAIQVWDEAVQQTPSSSPNLALCQNNLGAGLRMRYDRNGDLADLERAIQVWDEAVQLSPAESSILPACRANLGAALSVRYTRSEDPADLERSIQMYNNALVQIPAGSPELPGYLNDLGRAWRARYDFNKNLPDLEHAIQALNAAVQASSPDSPSLSTCLINLGSAFRERYIQSGNPADLDQAIHVHEEALQQTPSGSPSRPVCLNGLGNDLSERYAHSGDPADLARAMAVYEDACQSGMDVDVELVLLAACNWGNWALGRNSWAEAARAYTYGLDAGDQLFRVQLLRSSKESWLREARNLHVNAAYAFAQTGELPHAVEALERGHARLLSQSLERDRAKLGRLQSEAPDVYQHYAAAANRLHILETQDISGQVVLAPDQALTKEFPQTLRPANLVLANAIRQARSDLDAVVKTVRQVPGYAEFLKPITFAQIQQAIQDAPLIYLAATSVGGMALVVSLPRQHEVEQGVAGSHSTPPVTITPLWLNALTWQTLSDRLLREDGTDLGGYLGAYIRWRANDEDRDAWFTALDETTHWLGDILMGPLTQMLIDLGAARAFLIPQGALGLLPLHAAWREDTTTPAGRRYTTDAVTYSYISNALALSTAQQIASRSTTATLLAVDEPAAIKLDQLPFSASEIEAAGSHFRTIAVLRGEDASRSKLLAALSADDVPSVWHFSCHGAANLIEPMASGLVLANNELLTLRDLLALRLTQVRLAVLSACETGVPGTKLPDEVIGLPIGLTQVGVAGIVASLWSVNELSTTLLLVRFYDFWQDKGFLPAEALCQAQLWVRATTNNEKANYFRAFLPEFATGEQEVVTSKASSAAADDLYGTLMAQDLQQYTFAHPYYWAAFSFTGV